MRGVQAALSRLRGARGKQRRGAQRARASRTSTWPAAGSRSTAWTRVGIDPSDPRPGARAVAALVRRGREGRAGGRLRRLRAHLDGPRGDERGGTADRLRGRLPARPLQLGRRPDPRAPAAGGRDGQHGQHHRGRRRRHRRAARRRGDADRGAGRRAHHRPRSWRACSGDDQLRGHVRDLAPRAAAWPAPGRGLDRSRRAPSSARRPCASRARRWRAAPAWLVGGPVRDAFLDRPVDADVDIVVAGDAERRRARPCRRRPTRMCSRSRSASAHGARSRGIVRGRPTSRRCAATRSRPTSRCGTSRSTPWPARSRRSGTAGRSARRGGGPGAAASCVR